MLRTNADVNCANTRSPELLLHGHLHFPYQDHVRVGERRDWYRVIRLEPDEIGSRNRPYDSRNSWLVLELHEGTFKQDETLRLA